MKRFSQEVKSLHDVNGRVTHIIPLRPVDELINKLSSIIDENFKPENLQHNKDPKKLAEKIMNSKESLNLLEDNLYNAITDKKVVSSLKSYAKNYLKKF